MPEDVPDTDDTLVLLFLCCHPTLTAASQTAPAAGRHRRHAHLLEKTGDTAGACECYRRAAKSTASIAEQRYLESRASQLRR